MKISPALRERFIISADDYGVRQTARPILLLAETGKLDRVAVLVNYVSPEDARALQGTSVKIDLHLDLIRLLRRGGKPGEHTLWRGLHFTTRYFFGFITAKKVEREWRLQIEKFRELFGRMPDGLNSHEHVHYFPSFFRVAVKLATEYHIPYVRFGKRGMLRETHSSIIGQILSNFSRLEKKIFAASGRATSDYLVSFDWIKNFPRFVDRLPETGTVELIFHPERPEEARFLEHTFEMHP